MTNSVWVTPFSLENNVGNAKLQRALPRLSDQAAAPPTGCGTNTARREGADTGGRRDFAGEVSATGPTMNELFPEGIMERGTAETCPLEFKRFDSSQRQSRGSQISG